MASVDSEKIGLRTLESLIEVLETMVGCSDIETSSPEIQDGPPPHTELTTFIGLSGAYHGSLSLHASATLPGRIAAHMLCAEDPSELDQAEISDAIGEITNMVAGGVKTRCEGDGIAFDISVPLVALASEPCNVQYRAVSAVSVVRVEIEGETLEARVCLTPAEDA